MAEERGIGKCPGNHVGSYGYPTRPEEPYTFCPQCGKPMVWECASCGAGLPYDGDELAAAQFCRECGTGYFGQGGAGAQLAAAAQQQATAEPPEAEQGGRS